MSEEEKSIRQIWNELDNGAEPITEREKMVARQREKLRSNLAKIGKHLSNTITIESSAEVIQDRMLAPMRAFEKIQQDWANTLRKVAKYVKQHREEFDKRYEAYYPQMKGYLRKNLDLRNDEEPTLPISTDDMWELWICEIAPHEDWSRNLEREDFIEAHSLIEQSLDEKLPDFESKLEVAIKEYVNENLPRSTNKEMYKEVFMIVHKELKNTPGCITQHLLEEVQKKYEGEQKLIGDRQLRTEIPKFKNKFSY